MMVHFSLVLLLALATSASQLCSDIDPKLTLPCQCDLSSSTGDISINCDNVVFEENFPLLPFKMQIKEYRQRHAGLQGLTSQLFTASQLPLKKVDFSHNGILRLNSKVFDGLESELEVLFLQHNKLGDVYKEKLSLPEVSKLTALKTLNLGNNEIRSFDNSLLSGLTNLQVLQLEGNYLSMVPSEGLTMLEKLKILTLQENDINVLPSYTFSNNPELVFVNVSCNQISAIEPNAFFGLSNLTALDLSYNRLSFLNSSSLDGLTYLEDLDLSSNFFNEIPADAFKELNSLKKLHMQGNRIQTLGGIVALGPASTLTLLDLTRNSIVHLESKTFKRLANLLTLKLSINSVQKKNSYAFEGLESLKTLELDDHRFFSFPSMMLSLTPSLTSLSLNFNRIRVLTALNLHVVHQLESLSIASNIIQEIPDDTFKNFTHLASLNLNGNKITKLSKDSLSTIGATLRMLDLGHNLLSVIPDLDLPNLSRLVLSGNNLVTLPEKAFFYVPNIQFLDMSHNKFFKLPMNVFDPLSRMSTLDLSFNKLNKLITGQFNGTVISVINLKNNDIQEIETNAFHNLLLLMSLDLSNNQIEVIAKDAFLDTTFLHILNIRNNKLASFKKNIFGFPRSQTMTHLRYMDLSGNDITFIQDDAFTIHPRIIWLSLSQNRLSFFPSSALKNLQEINQLDLSNNEIESIAGADFANSASLRELDLSFNKIRQVSEEAFQGSSQLQELNLKMNKISILHPDSFKGIARLKLDLSHNRMRRLPENIFDRTKMKLLSLNLAHNLFTKIPVKILRPQSSFFNSLNMAHNTVSDIPNNADVLVNLKSLDLSYNPLTPHDINELINEPKILQSVNLAGTNINELPKIEARFLISLNLSDNYITEITPFMFEHTHNLRVLDLSGNKLPNIHQAVSPTWPKIMGLRYLDISSNPIAYLLKDDFKGLKQLRVLKAHSLRRLKRIDSTALKNLSLKELALFDIPMVDNIDAMNILDNMVGLEKIDIELSNDEIDEDLRGVFSPRLKQMTIRGPTVRKIKSSALLNLNSPILDLGIIDTNVTKLDERMFFLVPRSSIINLSVNGSQIETLSPKFIEDVLIPREGKLSIVGMDSNPLYCDCHMKAMRLWILQHENSDLSNATCKGPNILNGLKIASLSPFQLVCSERSKERNNLRNIITKDEINRKNNKLRNSQDKINTDNNIKLTSMDKIIIGVVGGVIGFVALLILLVCCVKCACDPDRKNRMNPFHIHNNCTCVKPPIHGYPGPYTLPPPGSRAGTLKSMPPTTPIPPPYGTLGGHSRASYYSGPPSYMGGASCVNYNGEMYQDM